MKKVVLKITSVILVLTLFLTACTGSKDKENEPKASYSYSDMYIPSPEAFKNFFFGEDADESVLENVIIENVSYEIEELNEAIATVILGFDIKAGERTYRIDGEGALIKETNEEGGLYWTGTVEGFTVFAGKKFETIMGFAVVEENPELLVTVTIRGNEEQSGPGPLVFGDKVSEEMSKY